MEDFGFYWGHRLLHTPWFYKKIHKVHHESVQTIGLSSVATHPIEFAIGNSIPATLGALLLPGKIHVFTLCFWIGWLLCETVDGHSGYEFPWSFVRIVPFGGKNFLRFV